ncbi:MAG: hypothetical protein GVY07_04795 [Bacteroidetes bacterium]|nr:hypothetical protein [Bacteroidota bacterium]
MIVMLSVMLVIACSGPSERNKASDSHESVEQDDHSGLALIYQMSFMSRYANKLYLAGVEENWELADIYTHEIEEITETIVDENHVDEGINVSELMEAMLVPQIEQIEQSIDERDLQQFEQKYNILVETCNQCHVAANYGAVKVTVPESNPFNQDFSAEE